MVVLLGDVVPFDVGVLSEVSDVFVSDAAVEEEVGDVVVLRLIGGVQLVGMKIKPCGKWFVRRFLLVMWWRSPKIGCPSEYWNEWVLRGRRVGVVSGGSIGVGSQVDRLSGAAA